jgi:CBS domain-containing protein
MSGSEFEEAYDAYVDGDGPADAAKAEEPDDLIPQKLLGERIRYLDPREAVTVEATVTAAEAIERMREERIGCVLVKDGEKLVGIFTERDVLLRAVGRGKELELAPVTMFMTPDPETLRSSDGIAFALNKMHLGGYRHVPIEDEETGRWHVVSVRDIVSWIVELFPDAVLNLPQEPRLRNPDAESGG